MSEITSQIRARLGVPTDANYVLIFDQAGHFDWDWIQTFNSYFMTAYSGQGVNGALLRALSLLSGNLLPLNGQGNGPYYYSMCEMGYLQRFVSYQAQQGNDVVSQFKAAGQSFRIVGGGITSPDSLVCSGEGFIRNYLLGRLWLGQTFPDLLPLKHCWIPDDFGQDPELPVVVQAMGMRSVGFSRLPGNLESQSGYSDPQIKQQLLQNGADFMWQSSDPGSKVYTHWLQAGTYGQGAHVEDSPGVVANIFSYLQSNNVTGDGNPPYSAAPANYLYVPNDDDFMMPITDLLADIQSWNASADGYAATGVYAVEASFDDFVSLVLDNAGPLQTVNYNGTPYWTGYYMSRPEMKILHYDTVRWLLAAEVFGLLASQGAELAPNYWQTVAKAWADFMPSTHHDYICGTANDPVYQKEQSLLLRQAHQESVDTAQMGLQALGSSIQPTDNNAVVIANPSGVAYNGVVELPPTVPSGMQGIQLSDAQVSNFVQPTFEGGLVFLARVGSLAYTTGYLTESEGALPSQPVSITPGGSGQQTYTLQNEFLTVVISEGSNWGIQSITDFEGNSLLASRSVGNDLVFYEDGGGLYQFGTEFGGQFEAQQVTFVTSGAGLGATVLEQGPVRVRLRTNVSVEGPFAAQTYVREYLLNTGEPFLRMKTTGAAPSPYSIMTAFPLSQAVDTIVHGTPCHWTAVQPWTGLQPLPNWQPPIFQATHRFLLPQADSNILSALYHQNVPAWAFSEAGVLIGCLLRNTPENAWGAGGTDSGTHTLQYAFRISNGLSDPTTGQPLSEALNYAMSPVAALINQPSLNPPLPESGFLASIASPGVILAAKPGDVALGTLVLRLYQPTNSAQTLSITLGAGQPSQVVAVTALEDPITEDAPGISIQNNQFTIAVTTALNTVAVTP
jgi:alpha-mannosidase